MKLTHARLGTSFWFKDVTNLKRIKKVIKHYYERARYGVSFSDSWDLCDYLTRVTVRGIDNLKSDANGHPMDFDSIEEWHAVLDEIKDGLLIDVDLPYEDRYYNTLTRSQKVAMTYGLALYREQARLKMVKYWDNLWD